MIHGLRDTNPVALFRSTRSLLFFAALLLATAPLMGSTVHRKFGMLPTSFAGKRSAWVSLSCFMG